MMITYTNCFQQTGFNYEHLLAFTGVFGIHPRREFIQLAQQKALTHSIFYNEDLLLTVEIKSPKIETLRVIITGRSEIYIDLFKLHESERGNGLGFKRMISQIEELEFSSFNRLRLWAYGDINEFPEWDGYIVWGKYGFTMFRNNEITRFAKKMADENISSSKSVNDLVMSQEGTALWKYIGFDWKGIFHLGRPKNMNIYRAYKKKKNL